MAHFLWVGIEINFTRVPLSRSSLVNNERAGRCAHARMTHGDIGKVLYGCPWVAE